MNSGLPSEPRCLRITLETEITAHSGLWRDGGHLRALQTPGPGTTTTIGVHGPDGEDCASTGVRLSMLTPVPGGSRGREPSFRSGYYFVELGLAPRIKQRTTQTQHTASVGRLCLAGEQP